MSKMIQVRNVPVEVHRVLKARAASAGMSLSDFLIAELQAVVETPSREEMRARLDNLPRLGVALDHAAAVRAERDAG